MEALPHADPYRCYLYHPTPKAGGPGYEKGLSLKEYYPAENDAVVAEVRRLFRGSFRTGIRFGQRHFSPSSSWRDEHVASYRQDVELSRFAVRVHVFEDHGETGGLDNPGRYLGFVALRPEEAPNEDLPEQSDEGYDYVVEAEITCPGHMRQPRYHLITTTSSAARLGVLPFRSAVYMAPRRGESRASTCVHLAVSQALHLVMSRFGCRPISQREFDTYVWEVRCGKRKEGQPWPKLRDVGLDGASLPEALDVLCRCSAGGYVSRFNTVTHSSRKEAHREAWRCVTDALSNGLPVVMMVNHSVLADSNESLPHAQLLFGMRLIHCRNHIRASKTWGDREDLAELPGQFVSHDVFKGPYMESETERLLNAAWEASKDVEKTDQRQPGINFLVVGPKGLNVDLRTVREYARAYMRSLAVDEISRGAKLLVQFYGIRKLAQTWWSRWKEGRTDWRYVVRLITKSEFVARHSEVKGAIPAISSNHVWVVEVWHPQDFHRIPATERFLPPPVVCWSEATLRMNDEQEDETPRGILHWDLEEKKWQPVEFGS